MRQKNLLPLKNGRTIRGVWLNIHRIFAIFLVMTTSTTLRSLLHFSTSCRQGLLHLVRLIAGQELELTRLTVREVGRVDSVRLEKRISTSLLMIMFLILNLFH